ncbi:MAG: MOSC domain-containing protein [Spirochaetota bacterium]
MRREEKTEEKNMEGTLVALCASERRGVKKEPRDSGYLERGRGLRGDGHAQGGPRQVSLLMRESIERMRRRGASVGYGDFAENLVTGGVDLGRVRVGDRIRVGNAQLRVTMIGKECHSPCSIYRQVGFCIMPAEGVFCSVERPGHVRVGDPVILASEGEDGPPLEPDTGVETGHGDGPSRWSR